MRKKILIIGILSAASVLVTAHEFWLEPQKFYFKTGEIARLSFRVGENFIGDTWKVNAHRIVRLQQHAPSGINDLMRSLKDTEESFDLPLSEEGNHVLVMESSPAFIKLDGEKFTAYLEEDGLDETLYERKKKGISGDSASEFYSRHTKLMLQADAKTDDNFSKVFGLPIEIIPEKNPLQLKKGDPIAFKILFDGKPLFGAKVKVWNRHNYRTSVQNIFSQQDGRIETHISNPGAWMVSVVKMVPSREPDAQYRSYWGTLVFGVR